MLLVISYDIVGEKENEYIVDVWILAHLVRLRVAVSRFFIYTFLLCAEAYTLCFAVTVLHTYCTSLLIDPA